MRYSRTYDVKYNPMQKYFFLIIVKNSILNMWYYSHVSNYPYDYDNVEKRNVKLLHVTMRYHENLKKELWDIIDAFVSDGFYAQENNEENQSIPEISHIHFLKEIDD